MRQETVLPIPTIVPARLLAPARQITVPPMEKPVSCGLPDSVCMSLVCGNIPSPPAGKNAAGDRPADTHNTAGTPTGTSMSSYSPSDRGTSELHPIAYCMYRISMQ